MAVTGADGMGGHLVGDRAALLGVLRRGTPSTGDPAAPGAGDAVVVPVACRRYLAMVGAKAPPRIAPIA